MPLNLVTRGKSSAKPVLENKKNYAALSEQIDKAPNSIQRLLETRADLKRLKAVEEKLNEKLKQRALEKGEFDNDKCHRLVMGKYVFVRRKVEGKPKLDEEKLRALCAKKGYVYPEKKVVAYEFDEDAFSDLRFTKAELAAILTIPESIRGEVETLA